MGIRIKVASAAALIVIACATSAADDRCQQLCAHWQLDAAASDSGDTALATALATFKEPRPRRQRERAPRDIVDATSAEVEASLGPLLDRQSRKEIEQDLKRLLSIPTRLQLSEEGADILIRGDDPVPRRLSPGVPHARVDIEGTAQIRCVFQAGTLKVSETYDRRRAATETYVVARGDGSLVVTREIRRPGIKPVRLRSVYRRT